MAVFGGLILTNAGKNLIAKAQLGKTLNFKRIALGDGQITSQSMLTIEELINETLSCEIKSLKLLEDNIVKITFYLTNKNLETGFNWREIGVIAEDIDTKEEVLFCYGNARQNAEYINAKNGADILELYVSVDLIVGNVENITATINESLVFATKSELDDLEERVIELEKISALINNKVDKVEGKGLSTNDFTNAYKTSLDNLSTNLNTKADKKKTWNIIADTTWTGTTAPYTKQIAVEGILATDEPKLYPRFSTNVSTREAEKEAYNKISLVNAVANAIELTCDEEKPAVALNLQVEVDY